MESYAEVDAELKGLRARGERTMIPNGYFKQPDTPSLNSPVGRAMRQLAYLHPELSAEILREAANRRMQSGQINWSKDEAKRLLEYRDLPLSRVVEQSS